MYDATIMLLCLQSKDVLVSAGWDGKIKYWNTKTWKEIDSFKAHDEAISCMVLYKGLLVTGSWDSSIKVVSYGIIAAANLSQLWNIETKELVATLNKHTDMLTALAVHDDYLLSSSYDHSIIVT